MRTSERRTFHKGSRHSAVTVCLLLVMCLVFLTACGKDKKDDTVANVNTEEALTNTEAPATESVIDTEEVVDTETETEWTVRKTMIIMRSFSASIITSVLSMNLLRVI